MLKILFVQKEGGIFGAENYHLNAIPGLLAKGVEIEFLRLYTNHQGGKGGEFIHRLAAMGVSTYEVKIGKYPTFIVLKRIHEIAKAGKYDLVHTHLIHADFYLALAKLVFRGQYILVSTKHGYDNTFTSKFGFEAIKQTNTPYFLISKWAEKRVKASFTISHGLRDFFITTGLTTSDKMSVIHYGFDMPENHLQKGNREFRFASKQIIIAGRLVAFKGHQYLIKAMKSVVGHFGDEVKLVIAGNGELEQTLKEEVYKLGLDASIIFLGYSKSVGAYMANSDVVVVPSISEGFGLVFLEAFSAKTPVVAWDVPAGNELIEHGKAGYLVPPYNTDKLANQLIEILSEGQIQGEVTEYAYKRLISYFNLNRMIMATIEFYQLALK